MRRRSKLTHEAYGAALTQMYWVRRRNYSMLQTGRFPEFDRMKAKDNVSMTLIVTDINEFARIIRKPEKYHIRSVINMRRAAMDRKKGLR